MLSTVLMNAQLNSEAQLLKDKLPEEYNLIKLLASEKWEGNHEMMVYVINNQAKAFIEVTEIMKASNYDKDILGKSLLKWNKLIKGKKCYNWEMVLYMYKNQLKAKNEY